MKKKISLLIALLNIALFSFSQSVIVAIDSVNMTDSLAYIQIIKTVTDTSMMQVNLKVIQPDIKQRTEQLQYMLKVRQSYLNQYADTTYSNEFRDMIKRDVVSVNDRITLMNRNRLELIAIRDSVISHIK